MEKFIGRQKELSLLEQAYKSSQTEFIPIYGKRRIGKSELILHFIKNKTSVYFLGKQSTPQMQIKEFLNEAAKVFKEPLLANLNITTWKDALKVITEQKKNDKKLVIVMDEFQWIAKSSPDLPSVLQEFLDITWKKRKDIFLILCGSYMGFMEKEVLGEKSPLFGRRTSQILLKPFSYKESAEFHPSWSLKDKASVYFICGGIPYYLLFFKEGNSLIKNIENNLFDEFAPLFREPDFLLKEELRELPNYYAILMCLASGALTNQEISKKTGIDERKLHYYFQHLIELRYVRRHFPLTSKNPSPKQVKFILEDPLLKFWFRFVYPNMTYISQIDPKDSVQNLVKPKLDSYFGLCFEKLCQEGLLFMYQKQFISTSFKIGEYWDSSLQIDIIGYRKNEGIDLCECKWGNIRSIKNLGNNLKEKMKKYPNYEGLTLKGIIFSQKKLPKKNQITGISYYDLNDLYLS